MKILNKFIWSKKEPLNKNDVWFDGSTWRMYTEEAWQSFTLPVDAADKVAKVIENVSEVYQEKLNAGEGIVIKGNTISVDDSIKYNDSDVWKAIGTLQQTKVEQTQLNDYVLLDRYTSTSQMLIDNISELDSSKADKAKTEQELNKKLNKTDVATINGKSLTEGGNITIKESTSFTPDWNAGEGEEGHIKNRTHYADFVEVDIPEDIASSEVELTIPNIVGAPILVHYACLSTSKYLKISPNDHELHVLSYGPAFKIRRGDGNNIFVSGHNAENHRLYIATHFVALNEIFLPETIARKSEIQNKLTELSAITRIELQDGFYYGPISQSTLIFSLDKSLSCAKVKCNEGDIFNVTGSGTADANVWYTLDKDETIIRRGGGDMLNDYKVVIGSGEKYLVVNSFKSTNPSLEYKSSIYSLAEGVRQELDAVVEEVKNDMEAVRSDVESLIKSNFRGYVYGINGDTLSGGESSSYVTDFILLQNVKYIRYNGACSANVAAIAYYDAEQSLIGYESDFAKGNHIFNEFPSGAMYVRFSFEVDTYAAYLCGEYITSWESDDIKEITPANEIVDSLVLYTGEVVNAPTYAITEGIAVKAGDIVEVNVGTSTNAAVIAEKVDDKYIPLLRGNGSSIYQGRIIIEHDCTIVISLSVSTIKKGCVRVISNRILSDLYAKNDASSSNTSSLVVESESSYTLQPNGKQMRCVVDFRIKDNMNVNEADVWIAKIDGYHVRLVKSLPSLLFTSYANDAASYVPELRFNSGFAVMGEGHLRTAGEYKPLVGRPAMSIWLKGWEGQELNDEGIRDRAEWLETNQDYSLVVENGQLQIVRDGIGSQGEVFNGGKTSVIFSTSLANKTLAELYNELSALDYLIVEPMDLTASKSCADLLQFGKVKLVGRYYQQMSRESDNREYAFDSFPFPLRFAIDESIHTMEIVTDGNAVYVAVDGKTFVQKTKLSKIEILKSASVDYLNVDCYNNIDDTILSENHLISDRTPRIVGLMGHSVHNSIEGDGSFTDDISASVTRIEDICVHLRNKGYNVMSLDELNDAMSNEMRGMSLRNTFFVYDDTQIKMLFGDYKTRNHISRYGYPMNFAVIQDSDTFTEEEKNMVLPMRLNGWCCASHSLLHDVPLPNKNSIILKWELNQIKNRCDSQLFIPNIIVYNWSGAWEPLYNMLELCGYVAAINSSGNDSIAATNPYNLGRLNIGDNSSTLDQIKSQLL